jgi:hypothetical protein
MGETADQLRQQVDQKRDDASQKIEQIEQQVMQGAQQVQDKVSETAQQVKAKLDWRQQVEQHPLLAVGAALAGGMALGGLTGKGDEREYRAPGSAEYRPSTAQQGGVRHSIRNAARESGLEDSIQKFASAAFGMLGERMREMTDRTFPGMLDKVQSSATTTASADQDAMMREETRPFGEGPRDSSAFAG